VSYYKVYINVKRNLNDINKQKENSFNGKI